MFLNELNSITKGIIQQPIAFLGGFCSGVFRLKLDEDPLATWLKKQGVETSFDSQSQGFDVRPQSINID